MRSLKINRLLPIYISILPLKFGVDIQSQTKVSLEIKKSNMATRRPFWKWCRWKSIGFCLWPPSTCIWSLKLKFQSKLDLPSGNHVNWRVQKPKNLIWPPGGHFENNVLKINRLLPIYICIVSLKFKVDFLSQSKVRVRKPKNPIWPPGGHF